MFVEKVTKFTRFWVFLVERTSSCDWCCLEVFSLTGGGEEQQGRMKCGQECKKRRAWCTNWNPFPISRISCRQGQKNVHCAPIFDHAKQTGLERQDVDSVSSRQHGHQTFEVPPRKMFPKGGIRTIHINARINHISTNE